MGNVLTCTAPPCSNAWISPATAELIQPATRSAPIPNRASTLRVKPSPWSSTLRVMATRPPPHCNAEPAPAMHVRGQAAPTAAGG
ncbi:hypothetical protein WR25_23492 [Diploscapter pachys]|uniref:Uncharacterized protein n=1 Tax=Diploscapter pachys TaxID=2018661 RepID=A0A2A2KK65_9BILA|nr:hypothetical protein WR25_23492 [Diploscapter pachys]